MQQVAWVNYQAIEFCLNHQFLLIKLRIANQITLMFFRVIMNCLNHFLNDSTITASNSDCIAWEIAIECCTAMALIAQVMDRGVLIVTSSIDMGYLLGGMQLPSIQRRERQHAARYDWTAFRKNSFHNFSQGALVITW